MVRKDIVSEIQYTTDANILEKLSVGGFFVGWPNPPSNKTFLKILKQSYKVVLAHNDEELIGFVNAVSDGVLSAYIPLLEVLPSFQGKGVGKELISIVKGELDGLYMIDVLCDSELIPYYEKVGFSKAQGVLIRNYDNQSGAKN